jgi:hypothetical protein
VINTAYIERLNATFRSRIAALVRRGRALARQTPTLLGVELPARFSRIFAPELVVPGPVSASRETELTFSDDQSSLPCRRCSLAKVGR